MHSIRRSRGRPATFDTELALKEATTLFLRHGYEGTSIAMLTEAMGVTPPTLYSAFGSKERLYGDVLARYQRLQVEHTAPLYDGSLAPFEFVEKLLRGSANYFGSAEGSNGCMIQIGSLQCGPEDHTVAVATQGARKFILERLDKRIEQAINSGELPSSCASKALSRFLTAVIQGMAIQGLDGADVPTLNKIVDVALAAWPRSSN
jgi:TetR/AcrR family transcriptional regulator, copper-responsive repressor